MSKKQSPKKSESAVHGWRYRLETRDGEILEESVPLYDPYNHKHLEFEYKSKYNKLTSKSDLSNTPNSNTKTNKQKFPKKTVKDTNPHETYMIAEDPHANLYASRHMTPGQTPVISESTSILDSTFMSRTMSPNSRKNDLQVDDIYDYRNKPRSNSSEKQSYSTGLQPNEMPPGNFNDFLDYLNANRHLKNDNTENIHIDDHSISNSQLTSYNNDKNQNAKQESLRRKKHHHKQQNQDSNTSDQENTSHSPQNTQNKSLPQDYKFISTPNPNGQPQMQSSPIDIAMISEIATNAAVNAINKILDIPGMMKNANLQQENTTLVDKTVNTSQNFDIAKQNQTDQQKPSIISPFNPEDKDATQQTNENSNKSIKSKSNSKENSQIANENSKISRKSQPGSKENSLIANENKQVSHISNESTPNSRDCSPISKGSRHPSEHNSIIFSPSKQNASQSSKLNSNQNSLIFTENKSNSNENKTNMKENSEIPKANDSKRSKSQQTSLIFNDNMKQNLSVMSQIKRRSRDNSPYSKSQNNSMIHEISPQLEKDLKLNEKSQNHDDKTHESKINENEKSKNHDEQNDLNHDKNSQINNNKDDNDDDKNSQMKNDVDKDLQNQNQEKQNDDVEKKDAEVQRSPSPKIKRRRSPEKTNRVISSNIETEMIFDQKPESSVLFDGVKTESKIETNAEKENAVKTEEASSKSHKSHKSGKRKSDKNGKSEKSSKHKHKHHSHKEKDLKKTKNRDSSSRLRSKIKEAPKTSKVFPLQTNNSSNFEEYASGEGDSNVEEYNYESKEQVELPNKSEENIPQQEKAPSEEQKVSEEQQKVPSEEQQKVSEEQKVEKIQDENNNEENKRSESPKRRHRRRRSQSPTKTEKTHDKNKEKEINEIVIHENKEDENEKPEELRKTQSQHIFVQKTQSYTEIPNKFLSDIPEEPHTAKNINRPPPIVTHNDKFANSMRTARLPAVTAAQPRMQPHAMTARISKNMHVHSLLPTYNVSFCQPTSLYRYNKDRTKLTMPEDELRAMYLCHEGVEDDGPSIAGFEGDEKRQDEMFLEMRQQMPQELTEKTLSFSSLSRVAHVTTLLDKTLMPPKRPKSLMSRSHSQFESIFINREYREIE